MSDAAATRAARSLAALALVLTLAPNAAAQIYRYVGPSPNVTAVLDFDNLARGPIAPTDPVFTSFGITSCTLFGTGFTPGGTGLLPGFVGQALVPQNGQLTVAGHNDPVDEIDAVSGFEIVLASPVDEFQLKFVGQVEMSYRVALYAGGTSLGVGSWVYPGPYPPPPHYWRSATRFDRIVITFPNQLPVDLGIDELGFGNGPGPPIVPDCIETMFAGNNQGLHGGAMYFDLTLTQLSTMWGLLTNTQVSAGSPVGLSVYTTPTTHVGNETDPTAWTLVATDDGTAVSAGTDNPTPIDFLAPLVLAPGRYGVALVGHNMATNTYMPHRYTNGNGTNQFYESPDGVLTLEFGAASNSAFTPFIWADRVWNGELCHGSPDVGTSFCGPAVTNSTGDAATITARGSTSVSVNTLTLECNRMPNHSFGLFLTSTVQGFVTNPGGSRGNLCLGGAIGRYVGAGQIQNSGITRQISLAVDLAQHPTPNGLVPVAPGETWSFQTWYRDAFQGSITSNFSDGVAVTFN